MRLESQGAYLDLDSSGMVLRGGGNTEFNFKSGSSTISSDIVDFEGLKYGADYSANFVDRSLVDKAYVDSAMIFTKAGDIIYNGRDGISFKDYELKKIVLLKQNKIKSID